MRSVLTILLLLIVLGTVLVYTHQLYSIDGFRGGEHEEAHEGGQAYGHGWENGGGKRGRWRWYGVLPYYTYELVEEPKEVVQHVDSPCSTDLDCPTGHCSMFGICTNGLSL